MLKFARETDGRWIAEVVGVPGALGYGASKREAALNALKVAIRAEQLREEG